MRLKDEKFYKTVRDFLDIYLIRHKGYSLNTQKSYREAIISFSSISRWSVGLNMPMLDSRISLTQI